MRTLVLVFAALLTLSLGVRTVAGIAAWDSLAFVMAIVTVGVITFGFWLTRNLGSKIASRPLRMAIRVSLGAAIVLLGIIVNALIFAPFSVPSETSRMSGEYSLVLGLWTIFWYTNPKRRVTSPVTPTAA